MRIKNNYYGDLIMNIMLLGAPGAGKGTQAEKLIDILGIPQVSTGDIFRENIKNETELGKLAKSYIDQGKLVPDEVTFSIVKDRLLKDDCKNGVILDGFPRTIEQADMLESFFNEIGRKLDYVVNVDVDEKILVERLTARRVCPNCKASYNLIYSPANEDGTCKKCGTPVIQRDDDKKEVIEKRLVEYHKNTEPLVEYYRAKGILKESNSNGTKEEALKCTLKVLGIEK